MNHYALLLGLTPPPARPACAPVRRSVQKEYDIPDIPAPPKDEIMTAAKLARLERAIRDRDEAEQQIIKALSAGPLNTLQLQYVLGKTKSTLQPHLTRMMHGGRIIRAGRAKGVNGNPMIWHLPSVKMPKEAVL